MNKDFAQVREEARRIGGEELVARVDAGIAKKADFRNRIGKMLDECKAAPEANEERKLAYVALVEALSETFSIAAVAYAKMKGNSVTEVTNLSIQSIANNVRVAWHNHAVEENDILGKIKEAAEKGGSK